MMQRKKTLFSRRGYPVLQNRVYPTREEALACPTGNIQLAQDCYTGLVQNVSFDPSLVIYDGDYDNEQGHSQAFRAHLANVLTHIEAHFAGRTLLEVGCGKGLFLGMLREAGFDVRGIDPSYAGSDPSIERALYEPSLGLRAECIVLRHVLEHIPDPVSFLAMMREANGGGLIYIEVPCVEWIAENNTWFDIFYEHVNYFRLGDLTDMFERVVAAERLFGGQYIGVIADLATLRQPSITRSGAFAFPSALTAEVDSLAHELAGSSYAIWGGASKGVVFSLLMNQHGARPVCAVDINPAKHNRFMGVSAVPIVSPEQAAAQLPEGLPMIVMNNNYLNEIRALTGERYKFRTVNR